MRYFLDQTIVDETIQDETIQEVTIINKTILDLSILFELFLKFHAAALARIVKKKGEPLGKNYYFFQKVFQM